MLLKGGTLLQHSLAWPPYRASVDLDLEVKDADALEAVLHQIEESFADSGVYVTIRDTPLPGFTGDLGFPRASGPDWALRIDALENDWWPSGTSQWEEIPGPWANARKPQVAPVETRVAQKLLLAAAPPYGRNLDGHHGRPNFIKDLFDLRCLGELPIQNDNIPAAAQEDVDRKSGYLGEEFQIDSLLDEGSESLRLLAHPPVDDESLRGSLWRAYDRVKGGIRIQFTRADVRTSAGCAHHVLEGIRRNEIDWQDSWRPAVEGTPRTAWMERTIQPVLETEDNFGPTTGPLEAWAEFSTRR